MLRVVALATLVAGCRISLETGDAAPDAGTQLCTVSTTSPSCLDAVTHADLRWIESNVFAPSCNFPTGTACHGSASALGKLDLSPGKSHDHLIGVSSMIDRTRKLVVPGDVAASYLMLMLRDVSPLTASPPGTAPPGNIGFMPQSSPTLCCQKLQAIERWIAGGAQNN